MITSLSNPKSKTCFSDAEIADFVENILENQFIDQEVAGHLSVCEDCFSKVASAVSAMKKFSDSENAQASEKTLKRVKKIPLIFKRRQAMKKILKNGRYLFVSGIFFILSFFFKKYFLQFLIASFIFGLKWIMDTGGTKALIMIYDAWSKRESDDKQEKVSRF